MAQPQGNRGLQAQQPRQALDVRMETGTLSLARPHLIHSVLEMQSGGSVCTQPGTQCAHTLIGIADEDKTSPKR